MDNLNLIESEALLWIQEHLRNPIMDIIMPLFSYSNEAGAIAILTVLVLLIWKKYRNTGVTAAASLAAEFVVVNWILKPIIDRIRPYDVNTALEFLGHKPSDASFPSGHTGAAFAVAFVMLFTMPKKFGIPATIVATLIAISRMYNGVHYPTDVLGALIIATITSFAMIKLVYPKITAFIVKKSGKDNDNSDQQSMDVEVANDTENE